MDGAGASASPGAETRTRCRRATSPTSSWSACSRDSAAGPPSRRSRSTSPPTRPTGGSPAASRSSAGTARSPRARRCVSRPELLGDLAREQRVGADVVGVRQDADQPPVRRRSRRSAPTRARPCSRRGVGRDRAAAGAGSPRPRRGSARVRARCRPRGSLRLPPAGRATASSGPVLERVDEQAQELGVLRHPLRVGDQDELVVGRAPRARPPGTTAGRVRARARSTPSTLRKPPSIASASPDEHRRQQAEADVHLLDVVEVERPPRRGSSRGSRAGRGSPRSRSVLPARSAGGSAIPASGSEISEVSGRVHQRRDRDHRQPLVAGEQDLGLVGDREVGAPGGDLADRRRGVGRGPAAARRAPPRSK